MIHCSDSLEFLKSKQDFEFDINYADVPYALGSEVFIQENGKPEYKKAVDFMDKWQMPNGAYWEEWFNEAFRTLKHGGYCLIFGIDRQTMLFKYYASKAGFIEQQSLYWYFISNFPKASDLSKNIDRVGGTSLKWFIDYIIDYAAKQNITKRELTALFPSKNGNQTGWLYNKSSGKQSLTIEQYNKIKDFLQLPFDTLEEVEREIIGRGKAGVTSGNIGNFSGELEFDLTAPSTELAKKYDGYKYSIAPLKQTNETIMVFQKPYKTGSCLHDTLTFENGDNTCLCGALNIDGNRVGNDNIKTIGRSSGGVYDIGLNDPDYYKISTGRYPSQTFVDSNTGEILDKQSGNLKGGGAISKHQQNNESELNFTNGNHAGFEGFDDNSGCSKILHKCDFETGEYDLYHYCPKVSNHERNVGCELIDEKKREPRSNNQGTEVSINCGLRDLCKNQSNNHPTLKPIALNYKILSLFKTPNPQNICYPFAGSGSEIIGGLKAGFNDYEACEINQEYINIAEARIKYWTSIDFNLEAKDKEVDKIIQKNNTIDVNILF